MAEKRLCEELEPLFCKILTYDALLGALQGGGGVWEIRLLGNFRPYNLFLHSSFALLAQITMSLSMITHF